MEAIEIARKLADYGQKAEACRAYVLAIHESGGRSPEEELEAAAYILQAGGNYKSLFKISPAHVLAAYFPP